MKFDMGTIIAAGITVIVTGGGTWLVSTAVDSKAVHAAQAVEAQAQNEKLADHEERTRKLEDAYRDVAAAQKMASEAVKQLAELERERQKNAQRGRSR